MWAPAITKEESPTSGESPLGQSYIPSLWAAIGHQDRGGGRELHKHTGPPRPHSGPPPGAVLRAPQGLQPSQGPRGRRACGVALGSCLSLNAGRARPPEVGPRGQTPAEAAWRAGACSSGTCGVGSRSEGDHREHQLAHSYLGSLSGSALTKAGTHKGLAAPAHPVRGRGSRLWLPRKPWTPRGGPQGGWGLCWHPESRLGPPARPTPCPSPAGFSASSGAPQAQRPTRPP